jgi:HEAT repeat protein
MKRFLCVTLVAVVSTAPLRAYVDDAPSLGQIIKDSSNIVVLQVDKVSNEKRVIIFQKLADLKGKSPAEPIKHHITDGLHPREPKLVMDWAEPGKLAIGFHNGKTCQVCLGSYWYECAVLAQAPGAGAGNWWSMTRGMPEQAMAYFGPAAKLREHVTAMLAGKEVVITAVTHGTPGFRGYDAVAYKDLLRGKDFPVWRLRASLDMPRNVYHTATDPKYIIGLGAGDADDVPGLVKGLADKDARVRLEAADQLGLVGRAAKEAVPALEKSLQDADALVRVGAAEALLRIDPRQPAALKTLAEALQNPQPKVRRAAADALGNSGADAATAVPALTAAIQDRDQDVRWSAIVALGRIGPAAKSAVPALIDALKDRTVAAMAADSLGGIGPEARAAAPALARLIDSGDKNARWPAALALVRIGGSGAEAAVPVLMESLKNDDPHARWDALFYMQKLGPQAKAAVPAILTLLKDDDPFMRELAVWTIGTIGPEAKAAVPKLIPLLGDENDDIRLRASVSLGHIGSGAVLPLVQALRDKSPMVRYWAAYALERMGRQAKPAVETLTDVLANDEDFDARGAAASALGAIGPDAASAKTALVSALKDREPRVRILAAEALVRLDKKPEAAIALLDKELQKNKLANLRKEAAEAIGRLGAEGKPLREPLRGALADKDTDVRIAAAEALWLVNKQTDEALPVLCEALKDDDADSRRSAAEALGKIGPAAKAALPVLARALKDDDDGVRKAAALAMRKIDAEAAARAGVP